MAELPEPSIKCLDDLIGYILNTGKGAYTADQLRAAIQAEREKAAQIAESWVDEEWPNDEQSMQAKSIARAIRGQAEGRE